MAPRATIASAPLSATHPPAVFHGGKVGRQEGQVRAVVRRRPEVGEHLLVIGKLAHYVSCQPAAASGHQHLHLLRILPDGITASIACLTAVVTVQSLFTTLLTRSRNSCVMSAPANMSTICWWVLSVLMGAEYTHPPSPRYPTQGPAKQGIEATWSRRPHRRPTLELDRLIVLVQPGGARNRWLVLRCVAPTLLTLSGRPESTTGRRIQPVPPS